jgi:GxxExxY protein
MELIAEEIHEVYKSLEGHPHQQESYEIIGICMEVHRYFKKGFLEAVYKDALEREFVLRAIPFEREKKYEIEYKGVVLPHYYFADFVVHGNILLEVKAQKDVIEEHYKQVLNYLAVSKIKLGLIVNFGEDSLKFKRVVL